ncbi:MAG TPA: glucan biosynthesis protein, partial [Thermodesulfobacteriota bacterium]|nr:glucan biosynthesis protein [Thermodesulfobacteriota bacterium]
FIDGQLETFPADKALTAVITVDDRTQLLEQQLYKNRVTKGWRLVFKVSMEEDGAIDKVLLPKRSPLEFRAFLKEGENAVTETWNYACQP